jgi:Leucine rich repeat N-terminal domain
LQKRVCQRTKLSDLIETGAVNMQYWSNQTAMARVDSPDQWRYGDEASLYSIAEDSREDRVSVSANNNGQQPGSSSGGGGVPNSIGVSQGGSSQPRNANAAPVAVELCLSDEETSSSDEVFYHYHHHSQQHGNRRTRCCQLVGVACIVCTVLGGIVATVLFIEFNRTASESRSASDIKIGESASESSEGRVEAADEPAADAVEDAPRDSRLTMAETHVFNALNHCLGSKETLLDPSTANGQIYGGLVQEVFDGSSIDETGMVVFAELHGEDFFQERYALEMLYSMTNGDDWLSSGGWGAGSTTSDPCSWFGVSCGRSRVPGTCAVTGVALGTFIFCNVPA